MIIGIDVGGTFTDVVAADPRDGSVTLTKVLTNYSDIAAGVLDGVQRVTTMCGVAAGAVDRLMHGTTIATNVIVQRTGARTAILTTRGFEDVLEMGRLKRRTMYDLDFDAQTPIFLAPRRRRYGIAERVTADGSVLMPLDEDHVRNIARELCRDGVEAVAVSYLFSFRNPAHEMRTREILLEEVPHLAVSLSSEVDPVHREYERTVVTAFDAYMRPKVEHFLETLRSRLSTAGFEGEVYVMQSRGGVTSARVAARRPVNLFLSGPAGGVVGSTNIARTAGVKDLITIDIGGTSCDVALIKDGAPTITAQGDIAGYPVRVPMVDISTIGAGGGSIIWVDAGGALRVGPRSAGSEPGPVAYGRDGTQPTITDASLILGYLNPEHFAGGLFQLDVEAGHAALEKLGGEIGLSAVEIALGAHRIMNVQIAEQVRHLTIKRGFDPRRFALFPFGGAGPVQAGAVMSLLGMERCVVPPIPGVLSAFGLLGAPVEVDQVITFLGCLDEVKHADLDDTLKQLAESCLRIMRDEGLGLDDVSISYAADLHYLGQSHEITIPFRDSPIDAECIAALAEDFDAVYRSIHGYSHQTRIELVNLRAVARKMLKGSDIRLSNPHAEAPQLDRRRRVWFNGSSAPVATPCLNRDRMRPGERWEGPLIVEQADTTIVVYPGQSATLDSAGNLHIEGIAKGYTQ